MVNLTRIYTRTGDAGETRLGDMSIDHQERPAAARPTPTSTRPTRTSASRWPPAASRTTVVAVLTTVQNDLFDVGADFCTPVVENPEYPPLRIEQEYVDRLEAWCDEYNEDLPKLRSFILNGGTPGRRAPARRPDRRPPGRAVGLGGLRGARRHDERAGDQVPQPALATCCSSSPGTPTAPSGDVLWKPGGER